MHQHGVAVVSQQRCSYADITFMLKVIKAALEETTNGMSESMSENVSEIMTELEQRRFVKLYDYLTEHGTLSGKEAADILMSASELPSGF